MMDDGKVDITSTAFSDVWVQVLNLEASPNAGYAYGGVFQAANGTSLLDWGCANSSVCTTTALGVGFDVACESSTIPYNLFPYKDMDGANGTIFKTNISWFPNEPNNMYMELSWKDDSSCIGSLQHRSCTLRAAIVQYPVQMQMNISSTNVYPGPFFSLPSNTTWKNDIVKEIIPVAEGDGVYETIYGGIAGYFSMYFNSEMNITTYPDGTGIYYPAGQLCQSLAPDVADNDYENTTSWHGYCNTT